MLLKWQPLQLLMEAALAAWPLPRRGRWQQLGLRSTQTVVTSAAACKRSIPQCRKTCVCGAVCFRPKARRATSSRSEEVCITFHTLLPRLVHYSATVSLVHCVHTIFKYQPRTARSCGVECPYIFYVPGIHASDTLTTKHLFRPCCSSLLGARPRGDRGARPRS